MPLEERAYRTLVVSSSPNFNEKILPLLTSERCSPVSFADSVSAAKRMVLDTQFDFVIINAPLADESGSRFAIDLSAGKNTVCLLFVRAELFPEIREKIIPHGVFSLPKPTSSVAILHGLGFLASARERLRLFEKKNLSLEDKMEEIRIVNRAKWLLIDHLKMSEQDAHRYIEKQAMDACVTKREIAGRVIDQFR